MREGVARLLGTLRAQRELYARMLARAAEQPPEEDPEALLSWVSDQRLFKTQIETLEQEAARERKRLEADPLPPDEPERSAIQEETDRIRSLLGELIRSQGEGMERWRAQRDETALRIRRLAQGRRAMDAYAGQRRRT